MPVYMITILAFLGIVSVLLFLVYAFSPQKTVVEERLERLEDGYEEHGALQKTPGLWRSFLAGLGRKVPVRPADYGRLTRLLMAAGMRKEALPLYMGIRLFLGLLLPAVYLIFYGIPYEKDPVARLLLAVLFAVAGYLTPAFWLSRKVKARQLKIFFDLPDMLDLMTVCVEAGMSMDAAMTKICDEQQFKASPLATEMRTALNETRAGKSRADALRDAGERSMVDDLKSFAAMLIHAERLGTSLAQSLKVHSDSYRTLRMQRAQEAAAKTTVKLVFPLVFFILPSLFIVMLMPAVIRMARVLGSL